MRERGVSTVVDAALCLVLVSASALTLVGAAPPSPPQPNAARPAAALLAASGTNGSEETAALLLADAALADVSGASGALPAARTATRRTLRGVGTRTQVIARWRPYPNATGGRAAVGHRPPPRVAVDAVTVVVPLREIDCTPTSYATVAAAATRPVFGNASSARRDRFERALRASLREEFDTPRAAARALTADRARVTVRTWSA